MLNRSKRILLYTVFSVLIISPATSFAWQDYHNSGGWDYYGSGRDHAYSAYIDRANYVGPADYGPMEPYYIDGSLVISNVPVTQIPAPSITQPEEFTVNIPNSHGGYNAVVIKRSGEGFMGPRGEYYPEFPKMFQLQMKYGS